MDLGFSPEVLRTGLIFYFLLFACLILRAFAQAWLADHFGDPTPRDEGRVTLYPVPHIDLLGTVVLPLICIFYLQPRIGTINFFLAWTNPVPINEAHFRNPQRDFLFTQFAGFAMSFLLALAAAVGGGLLCRFDPDPRIVEIIGFMISINAMLIVLDFLPVPPLPGGMLIRHWGWISEATYWTIARWSGLALIIFFNLPVTRWMITVLVKLVAVPFAILFGILAQ